MHNKGRIAKLFFLTLFYKLITLLARRQLKSFSLIYKNHIISSLYSVPEISVVIESVKNFFADPTSTFEAVLDRLNILAK